MGTSRALGTHSCCSGLCWEGKCPGAFGAFPRRSWECSPCSVLTHALVPGSQTALKPAPSPHDAPPCSSGCWGPGTTSGPGDPELGPGLGKAPPQGSGVSAASPPTQESGSPSSSCVLCSSPPAEGPIARYVGSLGGGIERCLWRRAGHKQGSPRHVAGENGGMFLQVGRGKHGDFHRKSEDKGWLRAGGRSWRGEVLTNVQGLWELLCFASSSPN